MENLSKNIILPILFFLINEWRHCETTRPITINQLIKETRFFLILQALMNPIERDDNNILKVTYLTATFIFQPPAPLLIRPRPLMAKKREGRGDTSRCWTRTHTYRDPPRLLAFTVMLYLWAHRYFRARTKGKEICLAWKSRIPIAIRGGHASLRRDCTEMRLFFFSLFFLFFSLHRFEFVFLEDIFFFF